MLDGLKDFLKNGFVEPKAVTDATELYKEEEDDFSSWYMDYSTECAGEDCYIVVHELHRYYKTSFNSTVSFRKFCRLLRQNSIAVERSRRRDGSRDGYVIFGRKLITNASKDF